MALGYAYSVLGDYHTAEDAAQEAFFDAYRNLGSLRDPAAFPAWFKTVLYYRCTRYCRRRARDHTVSVPTGVESVEDEALTRADQDTVRQAILDLPDRERTVTILHYINGYTQKEVAAFLDLPVSTVNNRLHASRRKLREGMSAMMRESLSEIRPSRSDRFRRRVIEGVMRVGYEGVDTPMTTPFGGCLVAALKAMGDPVDYSLVLGLSGMGFRMAIKGWEDVGRSDTMHMCPDPFEPVRRVFDGLGYEHTIRLCREVCLTKYEENPVRYWGWGTEPPVGGPFPIPDQVDEGQARAEIRASIDSGRPVLAFGVIGPPECSVVTGYDQNGLTLIGWNYHQEHSDVGYVGHEPTGHFRKSDWFADTPAYVLIGAKRKDPLPRRQVYLGALQWIVKLARTDVAADHRTGFAALREWEEKLAEDFAGLSLDVLQDRLLSHIFGLMMLGERRHGAAFLRTVAADQPDLAPRLEAAADLYDRIAAFQGAIWQHLEWSEDGFRKFGDPAVREVLAGHVRQAHDLEEQAVGLIESLLTGCR